MKKVYYIANARFPTERAHGIQLAEMCQALIQNRVDLELVVPNRRNPLTETSRAFYGLKVDIPTRFLFTLDVFGRSNVGYKLSSITFMISYLIFFYILKIRGEDFEIYCIDMDQFSNAFVPLIGKKYYVELHDAKSNSRIYDLLLSKAAGILVINNLIKDEITRNFNIDRDKVIVHSNGIDIDYFKVEKSVEEIREDLGIEKNRKVVTYLGKLYGWKGMDILIESSKYLKENQYIYMVGTSQDEFEREIKGDLPENIVCVGQRPRTEVPLWLNASDLLLNLGTKSNEYSYLHTSPMKFFEYMAVRKPILASDTPAMKDIAGEDEVNFYEPDNAKDLGEKIVKSLDHYDKDKIERAYAKVEKLSWDNRAKKMIELIKGT